MCNKVIDSALQDTLLINSRGGNKGVESTFDSVRREFIWESTFNRLEEEEGRREVQKILRGTPDSMSRGG